MSLLHLRAIGSYHQMIRPEHNNANIKQRVEKMNKRDISNIQLINSSISLPWCNICDRPLEYCRCENK